MISVVRCKSPVNCLFQYCFARVLAKRFKYRLDAVPLPRFPSTFADLPGDEVFGPVTSWAGQWPFDERSFQRLSPAELSMPPGMRIILRGSFQRFDFLAADRDAVRLDWLKLPDTPYPRPSGDFAITLLTPD